MCYRYHNTGVIITALDALDVKTDYCIIETQTQTIEYIMVRLPMVSIEQRARVTLELQIDKGVIRAVLHDISTDCWSKGSLIYEIRQTLVLPSWEWFIEGHNLRMECSFLSQSDKALAMKVSALVDITLWLREVYRTRLEIHELLQRERRLKQRVMENMANI